MTYSNALTRTALGLLIMLVLPACTPALVSSWTAPDATPFPMKGEKVAAIVMSTDRTTRRAAEDALARELTRRGAQGVPMYTLLPDADSHDEATARAAAERAGVTGVVVMRPVRSDTATPSTPANYQGPMYDGFWGGYYGHGWGAAYDGAIQTDTFVTIETIVYGLRDNKVLWAGQSKTTNSRNVNRVIADTTKHAVSELVRLGLLQTS